MSLQSEGYASLGEGGHTAVWMLLFRLGLLRGKGFLCGSAGKESTCSAGDLGSIPGLGRSPGEGKGYSLQYSGLENSMDCIVRGARRVGHD